MNEETGDDNRMARRGPRGGNDRRARIARWLRTIPASQLVTELVLFCSVSASDEDEIVARWDKATIASSDCSDEINHLIEDYADDAGSTCNATLAWVDADGRRYLSKGFRAIPKEENFEIVRPLDGSQVATLSANQRHTEAVIQANLQMTGRFIERDSRYETHVNSLMGMASALVDSFKQGFEAMAERLRAAELERDQYRDAALRAEEVAADAVAAAEESERAAEAAGQGDRTKQVLELVATKLATTPKRAG